MSGWIGVDLDGTLACYDPLSFKLNGIGPPVEAMVLRIKVWLNAGIEVRIVTARVSSMVPGQRPASSRTVRSQPCLQAMS